VYRLPQWQHWDSIHQALGQQQQQQRQQQQRLKQPSHLGSQQALHLPKEQAAGQVAAAELCSGVLAAEVLAAVLRPVLQATAGSQRA
jgi:hypothetical protein